MQNLTHQTDEPNSIRIRLGSSGKYNLEDITNFDILPTFILEIFGKQLTEIYDLGLESSFITKLKEIFFNLHRNYLCSPIELETEIRKLLSNHKLFGQTQEVEVAHEVAHEVASDLESEVVSIKESPFIKLPVKNKVQDLVSDVVSLEESPIIDVQIKSLNESGARESVVESLVESPTVSKTRDIDLCSKINSYMMIPTGKPNIKTIEDLVESLNRFDGIAELLDQFEKKKLIRYIENYLKKIIPSESLQYTNPIDGVSGDSNKNSWIYDNIFATNVEGNNFVLQVKTIDFLNYLLLYMINNYVEDCRKSGKEVNIELLNKVLKYVRSGKIRYPNEFFINPNLGTLYNRCKNM